MEYVINIDDIWRHSSKTFDIWVERYLTIFNDIWWYLTTEMFLLEPENYLPKYIVKYRHLPEPENYIPKYNVKYRHLSPSENRALPT